MDITCDRLSLPHGVTLSCRRSGAPDQRRHIVLLHGFPEAAFVWDDLLRALAPRARCVAPNLRGYEHSSAPVPVEAYRARHLVQDLHALVTSLGAPLDVLVAHDWGGALAWNFAAAHPALLRQLVIVNAPHPATLLRELRDNPAQRAASQYMNDLVADDAEQVLARDDHAALFALFGGATPVPWLDAAQRRRYEQVWRLGLRGPLNYYRASPLRPPARAAAASAPTAEDALAGLQLPDAVTRVHVPTRVVWGEGDRALLPGLLDGLEAWVPRLQIDRVPGASHWIVHEQPQRVRAAIEAALDDAIAGEGATLR